MQRQGKVIRSTGKWYKVAVDDEIIDCRLPGKFRLRDEQVTNPVAVGDDVEIKIESSDGAGTITEIKERKNYIPRKATRNRRGEQILVANIDMAWVVQSIRQPRLKQGFIDRFLVSCEAYEIPVGILINKVDLAKKKDHDRINEIRETYQSIGYKVLSVSAEQQDTIEPLINELKDKTSVFIGHSGVGKTSLINAVKPGLDLRVGEVSKQSEKGRHTTTFATLIPLFENSFIVDTPGIREFGLVNIEPAELSLFFPEMLPYRENCKFYNCTHFHEPQCGVAAAFEEGLIDPERYNSYLNILESLEEQS